jgi:WD40 repeat protein
MRTWIASIVVSSVCAAGAALGQGAPAVVWEVPTPNTLGNSVRAVSFSALGKDLAVGSTDRWFRMRRARDGALLYSVLEPLHSSGVRQILRSANPAWVGVQNESAGTSFRVQRENDGIFLGTVNGTVGPDGLVSFAPDAALLASTGGDGTISSWSFSDLTCFTVTGTGYLTVTTTINFSPDGALQTSARKGRITVQDRLDGSVLRVIPGGSTNVFSPDSGILATWSAAPANEIVLWRTSDWTVLRRLTSANPQEGVAGLRFGPDGERLVATGYDPYQDAQGLWQQAGFIRFWSVSNGMVLSNFDEQTGIAVTSPVAWSPDGSRFAYGLYDGSVAVANTPP